MGTFLEKLYNRGDNKEKRQAAVKYIMEDLISIMKGEPVNVAPVKPVTKKVPANPPGEEKGFCRDDEEAFDYGGLVMESSMVGTYIEEVTEFLDSALVRQVLKKGLEEHDDIEVVGMAPNTLCGTGNGGREKARCADSGYRNAPNGRADFSEQAHHAFSPAVIIVSSVTTRDNQAAIKALEYILSQLPPYLPPLLIVQHMPLDYTAPFVERLESLSPLTIKESKQGEVLQAGHAYIAQAGVHMKFRRRGTSGVPVHNDGEKVSLQKPAVDVLFQSIGEGAGKNVLAAMYSAFSIIALLYLDLY